MEPFALQTAIFDRLKNYADLAALLANDPRPNISGAAVFDHVPQNAAFPYVVIGDTTTNEWDTDDSLGGDHTATIHAWSEDRGREEAKKIQAEIYNALHRHDLQVAGAVVVTCEFEYAETIVDTDGLTRQGITRFRILTEQP